MNEHKTVDSKSTRRNSLRRFVSPFSHKILRILKKAVYVGMVAEGLGCRTWDLGSMVQFRGYSCKLDPTGLHPTSWDSYSVVFICIIYFLVPEKSLKGSCSQLKSLSIWLMWMDNGLRSLPWYRSCNYKGTCWVDVGRKGYCTVFSSHTLERETNKLSL